MGLNVHESHVTRLSDSSLYDERCLACGATDAGRKLELPCPGTPRQVLTLASIAEPVVLVPDATNDDAEMLAIMDAAQDEARAEVDMRATEHRNARRYVRE